MTPTFDHEQTLWAAGTAHVAGIDEAGRGALAGPVVAAAVVIVPERASLPLWGMIRDSKLLSAPVRAELFDEIQAEALAWGIGEASPQVIDEINIAAATRQAMIAAVYALNPQPDHLLIDWVKLPYLNIPQQSMAKADQKIVSVAAASILAKVHRDQLMVELGERYPAYGFASHKGYGTAQHRAAIAQHGPCPEHRHSFAPIAPKRSLYSETER